MKSMNRIPGMICLILALSLILPVFAGAVSPGQEKLPPESEESAAYEVEMYTGENTRDDQFTLRVVLDQMGTLADVPMDIAIVMDRSRSMVQPASTDIGEYRTFASCYPGAIIYKDPQWGWYTFDHESIVESAEMKAQINQINIYLSTLDKEAPEGYYCATNYLKRNVPYFARYEGFAAEGFASWEPLRYNKTTKQWEMRVTNGLWGGDFPGGINTMDFTTGSIKNNQVEWMSVAEAYKEYCARNRRNIYTGKQVKPGTGDVTGYKGYYDFVIATPKLTKAVTAAELLLREVYEKGQNLTGGENHTVSVLSFGDGVLYQGAKYNYKAYDSSTDSVVNVVATLKDNLGVSIPSRPLTSHENLTTVLNTLHASYTYGATRTDWAMEHIVNDAAFLPAPQPGRKQVVILFTDTWVESMTAGIADNTLAMCQRLKNWGVEIYVAGISPYHSEKNAKPYYMVQDMETPEDMAKQLIENVFDRKSAPAFDVEYLSAYEELQREFMIDERSSVKVFAMPYLGDNVYGEPEILAFYGMSGFSADGSMTLQGNGHDLTVKKDGELTKIHLRWTDARYAFLREEPMTFGEAAYPNHYKMGYRLVLEIPIRVNRDNTLGGNGIAVNTTQSGMFLPGNSPEVLGDKLIPGAVPCVNVFFTADSVAADGGMSVEQYLQLRQKPLDSPEVQEFFARMCGGMDYYKDLIANGRNAYLRVELKLLNEYGDAVVRWEADAASELEDLGPEASAYFNFARNQTLRLELLLWPQNEVKDSCCDPTLNEYGVEPYLSYTYQDTLQYFAPEFPSTNVKISHTLDLASDITLNYAVANNALEGFDASYMEVNFKGQILRLEPTVEEYHHYYTLDGITAVDLTEELEATLYLCLGGEVWG
ncbi:MAG: VWA domain-containing protein, partial [Oscillospiraceae bacterium]|nr:VWA domain-containing protein [Oscillospiraceae bacterium]